MSEPIRQHHVPQTYLQHFAVKKKGEFRFYGWDKFSNKIFPANIEDVAVEKHFYTVDRLENIYAWENFYGEVIEPLMGTIISDVVKVSESCLIRNKARVIDDEQKCKLAIIMVCQLLRGKCSREFMQKIFDEKAPQILEDVKRKFREKGNKEIETTLETYNIYEELFKITAMESVLDPKRISRFVQILVERCWIIYRINGSAEFITSDNPVMFMDKQTLNVTPFKNGLVNSNTVTFYPISSKLMIATYNDNSLLGALNSYDCKLAFIDGNKEAKFINNVNRKQMEQCSRQAFGKTKELLEQLV